MIHALKTAVTPFFHQEDPLHTPFTKTQAGSEEDLETMQSTRQLTVVKAPVILILTSNVQSIQDLFQQQCINWHTAKTPCMTLQCKGHVHSICNLKNQQKCAAEMICSYMVVSAVQLGIPQTLHLQDAQQVAWSSATKTEENLEWVILLLLNILSRSQFQKLTSDVHPL